MDFQRAILFFPDDYPDDSSLEAQRPLMLEAVLFCPLLSWLAEQLKADGVKRFFIACDAAFSQQVRACFDPADDVTIAQDQEALLAFLAEEGAVAVLPCEAIPLELSGDNYAYLAQAEALRENWGSQSGNAIPGAQPLPGYTALYSREQLQELELVCRQKLVLRHMANGVRFLDPSAVYLDPRVKIGAGTMILPGTILRGRTVIGQNCELGPNTMITDCVIGDGTTVNASQLNESTVGKGTNVGPYAYVRPGCHIGDHIKVGDFVEVKNSTIGDGTKIPHLTYVGDSDVGAHVNFGCGTITTNYDGFKKSRCTIDDGAFLGCNTNLIAPVHIGSGAYTAAGSTITRDVPADALAIERAQETVKDGWAARRRRTQEKK